MKWLLCGICGVALSGIIIYFSCFGQSSASQDYLRIHVRANSNSEFDQSVKYFVKDAIVEALSEVLKNANTKQEAMDIIANNLDFINNVADVALESKGVSYHGKARLCEEDFPARAYDELTLPAGKYDALIVDLGSGKGDNWWCIVYPAFCFSSGKSQDVHYTSKLWQLINSAKKR